MCRIIGAHLLHVGADNASMPSITRRRLGPIASVEGLGAVPSRPQSSSAASGDPLRLDPRFVRGGSTTARGGGRIAGPGALPVMVPRGAKILGPNDYRGLIAKVDALAQDPRVEVGEIGVVKGHRVPVLRLRGAGEGPKTKLLVTGGVHGNEPAGVAAAMLFVDQLLADPARLADLDVTVIPAVNPRGYAADTRRTPEDVDLNRTVGAADAPPESRNLAAYLAGKRFDLALDLHSGSKKRKAFWTLHRGARDLLVPAMARFAERWPVLHAAKHYTMTDPGVGFSDNRSTLKDFVFDQGTPHTVTLEAPRGIDYLQRVLGENTMVHEIVNELRARVAHGRHAVG